MSRRNKKITKEDIAIARVANEIHLRCLDDPIFLGAKVMGYDYLEDPAWFHLKAAKLEVDEKDFMLLAPRNHIKTTVVDIVFATRYALKYPNSRQLIGMYTFKNASLVLREIVSHFKKNKVFRGLFPRAIPMTFDEAGNQESFTVQNRTRFPKEATFEIAGQDTAITSRHYDVIRCSDLVVRENVPPTASPEQMLRTIEWFQTTVALLDTTLPNARITVDGTRWHDGDLYGYILEDPGYESFARVVCGIEDDSDGRPIEVWPRIGRERLEEIKKRTSAYFWASNYRNDPLPPEHASRFDKSWFREYEVTPERMDIAVTVDLAFSDSGQNLEKRDRTAILVSGISETGDLYILSVQAGRWGAKEIVDRIFAVNETWNPTYVGVEAVSAQKLMIFILEEEEKRRGVRMPLKKLLPDASKVRRALMMANHAERHGIYVKKAEHSMLIDECIRFPMGKHDDLVDCLTYRGRDLAFAPRQAIDGILDTQTARGLCFEGVSGADLIDMVHRRNSAFSPLQ